MCLSGRGCARRCASPRVGAARCVRARSSACSGRARRPCFSQKSTTGSVLAAMGLPSLRTDLETRARAGTCACAGRRGALRGAGACVAPYTNYSRGPRAWVPEPRWETFFCETRPLSLPPRPCSPTSSPTGRAPTRRARPTRRCRPRRTPPCPSRRPLPRRPPGAVAPAAPTSLASTTTRSGRARWTARGPSRAAGPATGRTTRSQVEAATSRSSARGSTRTPTAAARPRRATATSRCASCPRTR